MTGRIEDLTFAERMERLKAMAEVIVGLIAGGLIDLFAMIEAAARQMGVALSQMKYGLTYARSNGLIEVDEVSATVSLPTAA